MKRTIISLACCAFLAPLAFGQGLQMATLTENRLTVRATRPIISVEGGEVASYQPPGTLVVHNQGPGQYVLDASGRVFNSRGERVQGTIRAGTRVHVYFANNGGERTVDHIVVD